jgi:YHS domain-containing protein
MNQMKRFCRYVFGAMVTALLVWMVRKMFQRATGVRGTNGRGAARPAVAADGTKALFRDPVCGTYVAESISYLLTQGRENLHFCSRDCMERYQRDLRARDDRGAGRLAAGA